MDTLETLGRRIATTESLRSIVHTMKSLSAVSIRQYEQAVAALRDYDRTIAMGFQVVLRSGRQKASELPAADGPAIAVVFGSDHGLCGRFNEEIAGFARDHLGRRHLRGDRAVYLVAGARAASSLEAAGETVERLFGAPGSVDGLTAIAHEMLLEIDRRRQRDGGVRVLLFHHRRSDGAASPPRAVQLLPLSGRRLAELAGRSWPSRAMPTFTIDDEVLLAALVRQHLFIGLFRAAAESAASEHARRLAAVQVAERNIEENLAEMNTDYRRQRQDSITAELLDVVAGFEAQSAAEAD